MAITNIHLMAKSAVNDLADLSNDELDMIINDEEKIDEILLTLGQSYLKDIEDDKDNLIAENNSLAESNLSREPELVEGREKLSSLYEEIERMTKLVDEKNVELRSKGGNISLETALALLQTAASEIEEESEDCAKKFLSSEIELEEFLEQFAVKRKLMHIRLVKADKLSKILQRGDPLSNNMPNYINAPPVNINSGYFPGIPTSPPSALPYPTGPLNMPMANMSYFNNHFN
ncbi:vacuolar protein sorting 37B [Rhynchophorus ferrugineus]|uniref:vacuolar protein sorting 37B n=1 Tax=Rhynchophorus ferrugineus TaxID=354439 RepID=UPI003FCE7C56